MTVLTHFDSKADAQALARRASLVDGTILVRILYDKGGFAVVVESLHNRPIDLKDLRWKLGLDSNCRHYNFPGWWDPPPPNGTGRVWFVCNCASCVQEWPNPRPVPGLQIEVAGSYGVYTAQVIKLDYSQMRGSERFQRFSIESSDPNAPDYLRRKVHENWWISEYCSRWRVKA